jgi:hypothetical protein
VGLRQTTVVCARPIACCILGYIQTTRSAAAAAAIFATGATSGDAAKRAAANEDASRRAAEECLCLLAVLRALLLGLGAVEQEVMQQMATDLKVLINKQRYLQVRGQDRANEVSCVL